MKPVYVTVNDLETKRKARMGCSTAKLYYFKNHYSTCKFVIFNKSVFYLFIKNTYYKDYFTFKQNRRSRCPISI